MISDPEGNTITSAEDRSNDQHHGNEAADRLQTYVPASAAEAPPTC